MNFDLVNDIGQQVSFTNKYTEVSEKIKEIDNVTSQDVIGVSVFYNMNQLIIFLSLSLIVCQICVCHTSQCCLLW